MLELHIEQGPVLDREGLEPGIVDPSFGMRVIEVTLYRRGKSRGSYSDDRMVRCSVHCSRMHPGGGKARVKTDDDTRTVVTCGK